MTTARIFIDGEAGTTGLQIRERLEGRDDLAFIRLDDAQRKDTEARRRALNDADVAILCLPDDAAREAAAMVETAGTVVIDASSAHRTDTGWVYGFPEIDAGQREAIRTAKRITNPGCYALTGVAILHPLVTGGLLPADYPVTINAVSGYSGGGRKLIERMEGTGEGAADPLSMAHFVYGLSLKHKHVPEIEVRSGLAFPPIFVPSVSRYRQGMIVQVPLTLRLLPGVEMAADVHAALAAHYRGEPLVEVAGLEEAAGIERLDPEGLNGTAKLRLHVFANDDAGQAVVVGLIDNLGKGASAQAVQNLNIVLGVPETRGLDAAGLLVA